MKKTMIKTVAIFAILTLATGSLFAKTKKSKKSTVEAPEGLEAFASSEEDTKAWKATGEALTGNSCNTLATDTGVGVTIVVDKDISKAKQTALQGAEVEVVEYLGEKCLKVTPNFNPEIRISFVFDHPITTEEFKGIKFAVAGFEGGEGAYNCGIMYEKGNGGAEFPMSFYFKGIKKDSWTEVNANFKANEQWGNNYSAKKTIQAVQFWSGDKGPLFIKGLSFTK